MHTSVEQFHQNEHDRERIFQDMLDTNPALTLEISGDQVGNFKDLLTLALNNNEALYLQLLEQWMPDMSLTQAYECFKHGAHKKTLCNKQRFYEMFAAHDIHELMPLDTLYSYKEFFNEQQYIHYWNALDTMLSQHHEGFNPSLHMPYQELLKFAEQNPTHVKLFASHGPVMTEHSIKSDYQKSWLYVLKNSHTTHKDHFELFKQYIVRCDTYAQKHLLYSCVAMKFYALTDVLLTSIPETNIPWAHLLRDAVKNKNRNFIKIVSTKHPDAFEQAQEFFNHWSMEKYSDYWMKTKAEHEQRHITKELGERTNQVKRKTKI